MFEEFKPYSADVFAYDVKDQLKRFIYNRACEAFASGDKARDNISCIDELEQRKAFIRGKLIEGIGGLPSKGTPLNARITGTVKQNGYRIEKVIYESRPCTYVTANMYIPDHVKTPSAAVLFLSGHHEEAKHHPEYQTVCQYLVHSGLIVLAQDPVGQGERFSYYEEQLKGNTVEWGVEEHTYAGIQCYPLGDAITRYFIHDAMRSIDYLCTRPEVDPNRIGVTGNSGGGTQTALMMMCDDRIAAAAPGTFIMNRESFMFSGMPQDSEQIWPGMTACGFDHEDILMMMAPKPVLVLAVKYDFFPIEGTRRTVERTKRFWEMYGAGDKVGMVEDESLHMYTRFLAKSAAEFFSQHLAGKRVSPDEALIEPLEPSTLWCTTSGQVRTEMKDARAVYHENYDRLAALEKKRKGIPEAERRRVALEWLKQRVLLNRKICDLNLRLVYKKQFNDMNLEFGLWWSQEGILNNAYLIRDYRFLNQDIPVTLAIWDGGTSQVESHINWVRQTCSAGRAVLVVDVSGTGAISPNNISGFPDHSCFNSMYKLATELLWLDDSIAAMRTYDVLRSLDVIEQWHGLKTDDIQIYAHGKQGIYGQMAAVLDNRVGNVTVQDGMDSFTEWVGARYYDQSDIMSVILPAILTYFDLPDLEQWTQEK
jgi:hypothetical protein